MKPFHLFLNVNKPQNNKYTLLYFMYIFVIFDMSVETFLRLEKYTEMTPIAANDKTYEKLLFHF